MDISYINHKGDRIDLGPAQPIHYGKHGLLTTELNYDTEGVQIKTLRTEPREIELPIGLETDNDADGLVLRDKVSSILLADILAKKHGQVVVGEWAMDVFPTVVSPDKWWLTDRILEISMTLIAEKPVWKRKRTASFLASSASLSGGGLNFPHNYPHDYSSARITGSITNDSSLPSDMRMIIYGAATNPSVTIGQNRYQVNTSVPAGGYLIVDGQAKTITITAANGDIADVFSLGVRGSGHGSGEYIFEQIDSGYNPVTWSNSFGFDLEWWEEGNAPWI